MYIPVALIISDTGKPLVSVGFTLNDCRPFTHNAFFVLASKAWNKTSLGFVVFFVISAMTFDLMLKPLDGTLSLAFNRIFALARFVTRRLVK